jgi:hypothetical protein
MAQLAGTQVQAPDSEQELVRYAVSTDTLHACHRLAQAEYDALPFWRLLKRRALVERIDWLTTALQAWSAGYSRGLSEGKAWRTNPTLRGPGIKPEGA